jgi:DNA-binding response OmpR family regulator
MSSGKPHSVLVVDGESTMREFLEGVLASEGYRAVAAGDGPTALRQLGRGDFDAVVLDMQLPGEDGYELLCRIRQERPAAAVVVTTGRPSEEAVIQCMSLGAVRFLIKPFSVDQFLRGLAGTLADRAAGASDPRGITVSGGLRDWVELTAPSRQEYLDRLENFVDALYDVRLNSAEKEDLKIAISEIAANAMEWGNRRDSKRRIKLSYCMFPEEIVFKVEDEGEGFDPGTVPDPSDNPVTQLMQRMEDGKRVGGYGIYIVRKVMDKVVYSEKGNVVIMSKILAGPQATSAERRPDPDG